MAVVDDPTLEPEAELVFEREFERVARYEKTKAWTNCVAVGGEPTGEGNARRWRGEEPRGDVVNALEAANAVARLAEGKDSSRAQGTTSTKSTGSRVEPSHA